MEPARSTGFYQNVEKSRAVQVMGFIPVVQQLVGIALFIIGLGEFIKGKMDLPRQASLEGRLSEEIASAEARIMKIVALNTRIQYLEKKRESPIPNKKMGDFIHKRLVDSQKELADLAKLYPKPTGDQSMIPQKAAIRVVKDKINKNISRIEDGKRSMLASIATIIPIVGSIFWGLKLRS